MSWDCFYTATDPETGTSVTVVYDLLTQEQRYSVNGGKPALVPSDLMWRPLRQIAFELLLRTVRALPFDQLISPEEWVGAA